MRAPVTVWSVELAEDVEPDEVQGTLELDAGGLMFTPRNERLHAVRIPFERIQTVRRLRGSPVLMVLRTTPQGERRTAFYFAKPPPLGALTGEQPVERPSGFAAFRSPRRKARRDNAGYLGLMNRQKKALVSAWARDVESGMRRGGPDPAATAGPTAEPNG